MSDGFGLGDGNKGYSGLRGLAESKLSELQNREQNPHEAGRWPAAATVLRMLVLAIGAIVVLAWILTAVNS